MLQLQQRAAPAAAAEDVRENGMAAPPPESWAPARRTTHSAVCVLQAVWVRGARNDEMETAVWIWLVSYSVL